MYRALQLRNLPVSPRYAGWRAVSLAVASAATGLAATLGFLHRGRPDFFPLGAGLLALAVLALLHGRFLQLTRSHIIVTNEALKFSEQEFRSVFESSLDAILVLDDETICREANPAALKLFGVHREQLIGKSIGVFHPLEAELLSSWAEILDGTQDHGRMDLLRADGQRIATEFTATARMLPHRHLLILRDATQRLQSEEIKSRSLAVARSALREADALRSASLALTRNLRLNPVLDTVLDTLHSLIPYETAQVLLLETPTRLFLAREAPRKGNRALAPHCLETLNTPEFPALHQAIANRNGVLIADTDAVSEWRDFDGNSSTRCWLALPLWTGEEEIGVLSLAHSAPARFEPEHLRLATSLAPAASVAIQNARLYEQAQIYAAELERRLTDLRRTEQALAHSEDNRRASEDRFEKVFRSTPVPLSVTTLQEGRFLEVNESFERCFGYTRKELVGRTSTELGFWNKPSERSRLVERVRRGKQAYPAVTQFRMRSGELRNFLCSAETIQLEGQLCLLLVCEPPHEVDPTQFN